MISWDDVPIKHSLLLSGETLNLDYIGACLKEGIKVLWFGNAQDNAVLHDTFKTFADHNYLCVYNGTSDISLVIIDGLDVDAYLSELKQLEKGDERFNLDQYIIEHNSTSPVVIVQAGAGSGKTFVMTNRLLYLMHTIEGLQLSDIIMVTFTNAATDSMRRKLVELLNDKFLMTHNMRYLHWLEEVSQITISTIHSFLKKIILEIGPLLGYGIGLRMTSMAYEKRRILRDILNERYGKETKDVKTVLGLPFYDVEKLALQYWKKIENNGMSESDVFLMDWGSTSGTAAAILQGTLKSIFEEVEARYNTIKRETNAIAMSDIIHEFGRVIDDVRVQEYITSHYRFLFCDEFQDSDDVQIQTLVILDRIYNGNLFVVGDIKQSIYRFRGATDSAFDHLRQDIKEEFGEKNIIQTYTLGKNYRTSDSILNEIDEIFRTWSDRGYLQYNYKSKLSDVLIPQVHDLGIYKQIDVVRAKDLKYQFLSLLDKIDRDIDNNNNKTIMVLARYNKQLQEVKEWCEKEGRACLIRKRGAFFNSVAIREFCALIEAILYPMEPMYLYNLLNTAYCYHVLDIDEIAGFDGSRRKLVQHFHKIINEFIDWDTLITSFRDRPAIAVLSELIASRRPSIVYGALQKQRYKIKKYSTAEGMKQAVLDAKQYEADLQKLIRILSDTFSGEFSSLSDIATFVRMKINTDTEEEPADIPDKDKTGCVQGLTIHSAKGLEFDYVIIPFTNDRFGSDYRSDILIEKHLRQVGWQYKNTRGDNGLHNIMYTLLREQEAKDVIGDETRLLYVAMTRAKKGLFCFISGKRDKGIAQTWADLLPKDKDDAYYL